MTLTHSSRLAIGLSRSIKRGFSQAGDLGSGSGKGGGTGGSIRDAGGAFGKRQAAREEEYFKNLEKEQLKSLRMQYKNLRKEMEREIEEHESHAREHNEAAERLRRRVNELEKEEQQLKNQ
ncbi:Mitochondrial ATPase inhibitor IATP family protein [Acanthocheilonema viteae]